jgi:hypothetical protein
VATKIDADGKIDGSSSEDLGPKMDEGFRNLGEKIDNLGERMDEGFGLIALLIVGADEKRRITERTLGRTKLRSR